MLIKIQNPCVNSATHFGEKRAERLVRQQRAEWTDSTHTAIRLKSVRLSYLSKETAMQCQTRGGYDRIQRRLTHRELRHIPVVNISAIR